MILGEHHRQGDSYFDEDYVETLPHSEVNKWEEAKLKMFNFSKYLGEENYRNGKGDQVQTLRV